MRESLKIGPQPGPQTDFLTTLADIGIFGGAAGGGKTYGLLLEPVRHYSNPNFGTVIFRRNTVQIRNLGGLWDESAKLYTQLGGQPRESTLDWTFPSGCPLKFAHLEYNSTVHDWHGSQVPLLGFDELTTFTEYQFWYMQSRNRSDSGVPGYTRATCNPDADSWVRTFLDWWIDNDTGFPIKERAGKLRWFSRINNELIWGDSKEELEKKYGPTSFPKSLTFIPSRIYDNQILLKKDPTYLATLHNLPRVQRERLLDGNWNVRAAAGDYFKKMNFEILDHEPDGGQAIRYWDRASTKPNETNKNPDWTVGLRMKKLSTGIYVITDVDRFQEGPSEVEKRVRNNASQDGRDQEVGLEEDPGSAGKADIENYTRRVLSGYRVAVYRPTKDKVTRALGYSSASENNLIKVVRGKWNEAFFNEHENFPPEEGKGKDDQVDAGSGAFNHLARKQVADWVPVNLTGVNRFSF